MLRSYKIEPVIAIEAMIRQMDDSFSSKRADIAFTLRRLRARCIPLVPQMPLKGGLARKISCR